MGLKVQVWLIRQGSRGAPEALLLRTTPERGGFWQPVTGSVESGEDLPSAAARELREETGLSVAPGALRAVGHAFEFESRWGGRVREEVFLASVRDSGRILIDSHEHVDFKWVDLRQAEIFLEHESTKICLKNVMDFISHHFSFREN
jgi:8-oxo-dGTP pyrophosphatase MutT (NUDIX family)